VAAVARLSVSYQGLEGREGKFDVWGVSSEGQTEVGEEGLIQRFGVERIRWSSSPTARTRNRGKEVGGVLGGRSLSGKVFI